MSARAPGLWIVERPQRFAGVEVGTRMTVIALAGGALVLYSPVRLEPDLQRELAELGEVRCVIAPNRTHHLYVADYFTAFPDALIYGSPALAKKRSDLRFHRIIGATAEAPAWSGELDQYLFTPGLAELLLLHRATRTLILTDLVTNLQHAESFFGRAILRLDGIYRRCAIPRAIAMALRLGYRKAARSAFDTILQWNFDRVIMAHGDVLETDAHPTLARAFAVI
jgi:hypothetical protein